MSRPDGTNQCEFVSESGTRCERGTLTKLCRRHRKLEADQNDMAITTVASLDEIIAELPKGRATWDKAVDAAMAKKKAAKAVAA